MPVTVNITFENWIFKWIPHLCDPSYQSHCGKRQCGTLKWIFYFISILKKLCIFSLTVFWFFSWHCPRCVGNVLITTTPNNREFTCACLRLSVAITWQSWTSEVLRRNQSPSFQWYDAHVSVPAADAPSLCWHDATGPGSAGPPVFLCSGQFWCVLGIHWRRSTSTRSFVTEGEKRHKGGGRAMRNKRSISGWEPWLREAQSGSGCRESWGGEWVNQRDMNRRRRWKEFRMFVSALSP